MKMKNLLLGASLALLCATAHGVGVSTTSTPDAVVSHGGSAVQVSAPWQALAPETVHFQWKPFFLRLT
jgi:hypothetical protein